MQLMWFICVIVYVLDVRPKLHAFMDEWRRL
jgi:hypothetical protein